MFQILSAVCYVISEITEDEQILAIMDDYGLLDTLEELSNTVSDVDLRALFVCILTV